MTWRLAIAIATVLLAPTHTRWQPRYADGSPYVAQWFADQRSPAGQWCCDQADGHLFYGTYTPNADGSVDATDELGKTYHIGKDQVLSGPNPTGTAVWWFAKAPDGAKYTYCFALGPQT